MDKSKIFDRILRGEKVTDEEREVFDTCPSAGCNNKSSVYSPSMGYKCQDCAIAYLKSVSEEE